MTDETTLGELKARIAKRRNALRDELKTMLEDLRELLVEAPDTDHSHALADFLFEDRWQAFSLGVSVGGMRAVPPPLVTVTDQLREAGGPYAALADAVERGRQAEPR
jgi:hypothetical protein